MPRSLSSMKRQRQNVRRAALNKTRRSELKTRIRKVQDAIHGKDAPAADTASKSAVKLIDRSADRGTIHRNTAARRKSRLARQLKAMKGGK